MMLPRRTIGYVLLSAAAVLILFVSYINAPASTLTRQYSPYTLLISSWEAYKKQFITEEGRVIDHSLGITTSEGQSYALLRSVAVDDKETFDLVWTWTKNHLGRPSDKLFGWKWGIREDGSEGFLAEGGDNSAADADSDIALALLLAARRWGDSSYTKEARAILSDLWNIETAEAAGKRYLIAGNWAQSRRELVINVSYFAPYAWRLFADADHDHDWEELITPAYELLLQSARTRLDRESSAGFPPDWLSVSREEGSILPPPAPLSTRYSYDAMRVPWRVALDYQWYEEPRAQEYLKEAFRILEEEYRQTGKLRAGYEHNGTPLSDIESPSMYATSMGYFLVSAPELAEKIYTEKIVKLYSNSENTFREDLPYYDQNWLWFGAALYNRYLSPYEDL